MRHLSYALLILLALAAVPASAGELWPNDYLDFFSEDMQPVQVTLRRDMFTKDGEQVTITLPRAWIAFTPQYNPLKLDRLPDAIETTAIALALTDPDGAALSIRSRTLAREQRISWGEAIKRLRADEYRVTLSYIPARIRTEDLQYGIRTRGEELIARDELKYDPSRGEYLSEIGSDLLFRVRCQVEATSFTFCTYYSRPGKNISLKADFLDFRLHGGRHYANERMGRLIAAVCHQIKPHCLSSDGHVSESN